MHLPQAEVAYALRALKDLIGDRLVLPSDPELTAELFRDKSPYGGLTYREEHDPIRSSAVARQPLRSKWLGVPLRIAALGLLFVGLAFQASDSPALDLTFGLLPDYSRPITFSAIFGCVFLINWIGRELCLPDAARLLKQGRRPILYLRSFRDDGKAFRKG